MRPFSLSLRGFPSCIETLEKERECVQLCLLSLQSQLYRHRIGPLKFSVMLPISCKQRSTIREAGVAGHDRSIENQEPRRLYKCVHAHAAVDTLVANVSMGHENPL